MKRIVAGLLTLAILVGGLAGCAREPAPEGTLTVTVLDVGKADCILIQESSGGAMLIDTGTRESASAILEFLRARGIDTLETLLLTHMDKDHIGGAAAILQAVKAERVVQPGASKDSGEYTAYQAALREKGIEPEMLWKAERADLGGAVVTLIPGRELSYKQSNDYSVFTEITYGDHRFLFTGDGEKKRLQEYLDGRPDPCDFLKVPHHGRAEKNSEAFFEAVAPRYAVITCSEEEPPEDEVLALLKAAGAKTYLTSGGTVTAVSDGRTLTVTQ